MKNGGFLMTCCKNLGILGGYAQKMIEFGCFLFK